jgi:hypothetical protein
MKKLMLVMVLAAAAAALSCSRPSEKADPAPASDAAPAAASLAPGQKKVWIYFTKNHNKGTGTGQYDTDCVGIVGTETVGTKRGYKIMWQVHPSGGADEVDKCEMLDNETVNLRFQTDVMGAMAMKKLTANAGGVIQGEVSMSDDDIGAILAHKYQVFIGDKPAGPDPVIIVGCSSCGPDIP